MITFLKIFLGIEGTWLWACRKMQEGKTVYRFRDSGTAFFKYDKGQRKIISYVKWGVGESSQWLSMEDVFATDFMLWHERTDYAELHRQSQMKCDSKSLKGHQLKKHFAPKPIKPHEGLSVTVQLLNYMRSSEGFTEQDDTQGRRFHYCIHGEPVAYISFKHIWGGYKFMPYSKDAEPVVIKSVDHLKTLKYHIDIKHLTSENP